MQYDKDKNVMFCKDCIDHGLKGQWSTGTINFRKKTSDHLASKEYALSSAANNPAQPTISMEVKRAEEKRMKSCFWGATEEIPNSKFKTLLKFLRHLEIPEPFNFFKSGNVKYDSQTFSTKCLESSATALRLTLQLS